jgi:hypothetical protein
METREREAERDGQQIEEEACSMSVPAGLLAAVRGTLVGREGRTSAQCPACGTILDAPRLNPVTGRLARKCMSCREWHPLADMRLRRGE